jgi:hypothetical protein
VTAGGFAFEEGSLGATVPGKYYRHWVRRKPANEKKPRY